MTRSLRSKAAFEASLTIIKDRTLQGYNKRQIADELGISQKAVQYRLRGLVKANKIDMQAVSLARRKPCNASLMAFRERGVTFGRMKDMVNLLNVKEAYWLAKQIPEGATVSDFLVMLVRDAYAEEADG